MIFYFSATGNSQYAAERLAAGLGERAVSIGGALRAGEYDYDVSGDAYIGFVIPTFAWTIPGAVARFIDRMNLTGAAGKHGFAVITAGEGTGGAPGAIRAALEGKGIPYSGSFDLIMIDNYIVWSDIPTGQALTRRLGEADARLDEILRAVREKTAGELPSDAPKDPFMPFTAVDSAAGSCGFTVSAACTGCGTCAALCPTRCIQMADGRPVWKGECTVCFACLHRCPETAIDFGRETVGKRRYVHPGVEALPAD